MVGETRIPAGILPSSTLADRIRDIHDFAGRITKGTINAHDRSVILESGFLDRYSQHLMAYIKAPEDAPALREFTDVTLTIQAYRLLEQYVTEERQKIKSSSANP